MRGHEFVESIFKKYAVPQVNGSSQDLMPVQSLPKALNDLKIPIEGEPQEFVHQMDTNNDQFLDFQEFSEGIKKHTQLERWALGIPMHRLLADACSVDNFSNQADLLKPVSKLSKEQIHVLCKGMLDGLERILFESVQALNHAYTKMEKIKNSSSMSKFTVLPSMSCGGPKDFHAGLEQRIGTSYVSANL